MSKKSTKELLEGALEQIETRGWVQGDLVDEGKCCILGGMLLTEKEVDPTDEIDAKELERLYGDQGTYNYITHEFPEELVELLKDCALDYADADLEHDVQHMGNDPADLWMINDSDNVGENEIKQILSCSVKKASK